VGALAPRWARFLLARDPERITRTLRVFLAEVFKSHRRRARALGLLGPECGAGTFVQYFGSALNLTSTCTPSVRTASS
jgi:hypothetical protein